jgi:biopolymer transport protein ExbD
VDGINVPEPSVVISIFNPPTGAGPVIVRSNFDAVPPRTEFGVKTAVAIDARGFYVDNQPTPLTLVQLRTRLTALAAESKPPVIRVRGDATVPFQKVAEVMTELQRAGLTRITIDSKTDS